MARERQHDHALLEVVALVVGLALIGAVHLAVVLHRLVVGGCPGLKP